MFKFSTKFVYKIERIYTLLNYEDLLTSNHVFSYPYDKLIR